MKRAAFRTILMASLVTVMLITAAYAVVNARIQLNTKEHKNGLILMQDGAEVRFEPLTDAYIAFQSYRPLWVPDGYALTHISEVQYGTQLLMYSTDKQSAPLTLYVCSSSAGVHREGQALIMQEVIHEEKVSVGSIAAVMYTMPDNGRCLAWVDDESGFGFFLTSADPSMDMLRIAESVVPDPALISTEHDSELALQLLGDYRISALPAGYAEAERGAWFLAGETCEADIYIWYRNAESNSFIEFEYTNVGFCEEEELAYCYEDAVPVTINGMYGMARDNTITLLDKDSRLVYTVTATNMDVSDLLQLVESIDKCN